MLSKGNNKIGDIYNFSLPALITCPGASEECLKVCYAKKGRYVFSKIQDKYMKNLVLSFRNDFNEIMSGILNSKTLNEENIVVRVHPSGDFYSEHYIKQWQLICKKCPDITFYGYTRSWRVDKLHNELTKLANLDNMNLYASTDSSTPEAEKKLEDWNLEASFLIEPYTSNNYKECYRETKCKICKNCLYGKNNVRFMEQI